MKIKKLKIRKESKNIYLIIPLFLILFAIIGLVAICFNILNSGLNQDNLKILIGSIILGISGVGCFTAILSKGEGGSTLLEIDEEGISSCYSKIRWNDIKSISHMTTRSKKYLLIYPSNTYIGRCEYYIDRWTNKEMKVMKIDITATNFKTFKICRVIKYNLKTIKKLKNN